MPGYDDETLNTGAKEGHCPKAPSECKWYVPGSASTREKALIESEEFNEYANGLVKGFAK